MSLEEEREIVKKEFEARRSEVLAALPETYKSLWGRVGFAKTNWGTDSWLPAKFLGPYEVPPTSPMRQLWMEMFNKLDRKDAMPVLVYWYGATDVHSTFSIVPWSCVQVLIVRKHAVKLPEEIQRKLTFGRTDLFTRSEAGIYRAYYAMIQDLTKGTQQIPFQEFYQDDNYVLSARAIDGRTDGVIERNDAGVSSSGTPVPAKRSSQSDAASATNNGSLTKKRRHSKSFEVPTTITEQQESSQDGLVQRFPIQQQSESRKPAVTERPGVDVPSEPPNEATHSLVGHAGGLAQLYQAYEQRQASQQEAAHVRPPPPPPLPPAAAAPSSAAASTATRSTTNVDSGSDHEMMLNEADVFLSSLKPIKECQGQINLLVGDDTQGLNHAEAIEATLFWRRMVEKWKNLLPFYRRESCPTETLLLRVDRFMAAIAVIKECQQQIKVLASDMSRTRMEIAQETLLWRTQEAEWKKRLPFYDSCSVRPEIS